jgi:para-aminobenzoate synthetase/4-amino-4-deoxychorismate lyase
MIVDLIRNDMARVSLPGSVQVPELFSVETYPSFYGMTSTVTGRLGPGVRLPEIVRALFPCGSVTGAPKIRAQQIIRELEEGPRGIYTGAMGHFAPDGDFTLNVAIRTAHIGRSGDGAMGIGSGIVWDSACDAEYDECLLKAAFLTGETEPFRLIETLLWTPDGGFHLLAEHLERLESSAAWFGFTLSRESARAALESCTAALRPAPHRVRLLLDEKGYTDVTATRLAPSRPAAIWRYALSPHRMQSCDPFLRHKTTRRTLFDTEHARVTRQGCDDVLFLNERGELTEGSRTTIFLQRGGTLVTPPLSSGVLDGVLRRALMRDPAIDLREAVLYPDDLATADGVLLGNSVRGLIPARPVRPRDLRAAS